MIAVLLVGTALLISNLRGYDSLWVDEGWSMIATQEGAPVDVTRMVAEDVHPPLYFYLLYIWRFLIGDSVFVARFLTVLITLVGTALIYRLGSDVLNRFTGVVGASLYITHDLVIVLGREVRQYPFLQLLTVLTVWTYWRFWQVPIRRRVFWFILSGIALLWTNYWGGFVLLALGLHSLITRRRQFRPYFIAYGIIGLSFVPWLPVLYSQLTQNIPTGIGHALPASRLGYEVLAFQILGRPELLWGLLVIVGGVFIRPWHKASLLLSVVVLPVMLTIIINLDYAVLSFRTLSLTIPIAVLLVAFAIAQINRWQRYGGVIVAVVAITLSVALVDAEPPNRLPWNDIAFYTTMHSDNDDAVLIETWFDTYALQYYLEQHGDISHFPTEVVARREGESGFERYLDDILPGLDGLWAVRFSTYADIIPMLQARDYQVTGRINWQSGIELVRFDRTPSGEPVTNYADTLLLHTGSLVERGADIGVNLLWQPLIQPEHDYVVSVFALDQNGGLIAQDDSPPLDTSTRTWTAGEFYFDPHLLTGLAPGTYDIGVRVYWFTDDTFENIAHLTPVTCDAPCDYIVLERVTIHD